MNRCHNEINPILQFGDWFLIHFYECIETLNYIFFEIAYPSKLNIQQNKCSVQRLVGWHGPK